ncbi:MAG TPA: hypothetical protein VGG14_07925 [Candidatus Sulfotelmatobacter sp.]
MHSKIIVAALALATSLAYGKDLNAYQNGNLEAMNLISCAADSRNAAKSQDPLCPEYTLQTDQVVYSIRPVDQKHPILLPVGAQAKFRLQNTTLMVRVPSLDTKERKFSVVSVKPLGENSANTRPVRLNHLQ